MKTAAGVVAVLAWGSVLAAVWCGYVLPAAVRPSFGMYLAIMLVSTLIGIVVPAYLLGLEMTPAGATGKPQQRDE